MNRDEMPGTLKRRRGYLVLTIATLVALGGVCALVYQKATAAGVGLLVASVLLVLCARRTSSRPVAPSLHTEWRRLEADLCKLKPLPTAHAMPRQQHRSGAGAQVKRRPA